MLSFPHRMSEVVLSLLKELLDLRIDLSNKNTFKSTQKQVQNSEVSAKLCNLEKGMFPDRRSESFSMATPRVVDMKLNKLYQSIIIIEQTRLITRYTLQGRGAKHPLRPRPYRTFFLPTNSKIRDRGASHVTWRQV